MKTSPRGLALIESFEGLRLEAYKDIVGVVTIGYGHTGPKVVMGDVVTEEEAVELLQGDVMHSEDAITSLITVPLKQNQFDALVSFTYNLGEGALRDSTLRRKINAERYDDAAIEFLRWNRAGGVPVAGLTRRRTAERDLFMET